MTTKGERRRRAWCGLCCGQALAVQSIQVKCLHTENRSTKLISCLRGRSRYGDTARAAAGWGAGLRCLAEWLRFRDHRCAARSAAQLQPQGETARWLTHGGESSQCAREM